MSWSQLVGNSFTQISVINANDIWALDGDGKISRWNGVRWTEIPGQLRRIATGKAGIFGVTPKDILYAWRNDKWEKLPGKASFVEVGSSAWVLNNGTPYKFVDEKWVKQAGSNFKSLTVGDDGSVWAITNEGAIKSFENDSWVSIEGSFKEISIVNKSFVWAIDESGKLFKRNEATFEEKPNPHNIVSISTSDDYLVGLDATGNVFVFHDVLYLPGWNNLTPKQFKIKNLDVAGRNHAWAITENDEVIYYDEKQNNWEITDSRMVNVSCSGGEVWTIDVDGKVYYRSTDSWIRRNGNLKKLSVGGANVWGISKEGYTFCWNGGNWDKLSGAFSDISVGSDGDVWAVNGAGLVYHWENNFFKLISDAPKLNQISVGRTNNVFGISVENDENILYKWNSSEKTFQKIDNHYHLKYISVHSNSHYWGIDTKGEVYVYSIEEQPIEEKQEVTNFGWISDTNKWSSVSLATSCQIWSLSPEGVPYTTNSADKKLDNPIQQNGKDLKVIAASKDFVWALDKKGGVFQWLSARKLWQQKAGVFKHISNGGSYAVVVNVEGKALRWTGSAWDYLPASPVLKTAAVGRDNQFWAIDEKGTALSLINTKWIEQPFSSPLKYIALGTNDSVWALSQDDKLINFDTKKKEWIEVENPHKFVSISVYSNDHIVGIDANGNLHVTDRPHNVEDFESLTNSDEPNTDMSFWDLIPGKLSSISVGNQDYIYGIASGKIYRYVPTTEGKLPWVQVQGSLVDVSVGNDGSVWGVSKSGRAYQLKGDEWVKHDGEEEIKFKQITCASKDVVWGVDTSGRVFQWNGVQFSLKPPPYMKTIDASPDGTIWGLTLTGNSVYSWTDGDWKQRAQPPGQISLISVEDGDNAWVLSKTGKVSRWNDDESAWQAINGKLSYIASSKHNIWGIDENHLIYKLKKEALSGGANTEELQRISQENEKNKKIILDLEKKLEKLNKHLEKTSLLYEQKLSSFTTDMNRSKEDREKAAEEIKRLHKGMQDYESHLKEAKENSRVLEEHNKSLNERLENSKLENEELLKKKEEEERKLRICTWRIVVQTGDLRGAGCDANVSIVLHGDEGTSQEIVLDNDPRNFRRNRKDEFTVRTSEDIGLLQKISIGHDNSGFSPNWYLGWIQILNYRDEKWNFVAASWLDTESGIRKELTPHEGEIVIPKVVVYKLKIFTGDRPGAGTNAKVTCTLHSEDGRFASTLIDSAKFERNQTVEAGIEAIDLGTIKKLQVSHDNTGFAPGWFLDKIIMTNMATGEIKYFLCGKWLATDEDDGHLQRELLPKDTDGVAYLPMNQYTVKVHTGDRRGAGTDANVFITLYGKDSEGNLANSGEKILDTSANNFERAQIDVFGISCISLGSLEYIRIRHDNSGFGPGWFLDKVIVRNETTGGEFFFICGRWLATNEDDRQIVREIPAEGSDRASYDKMVTYKIEVFTGDRRGAGTDANVNICIYGEKGDTGNRPLDSSANDFERNQTDVFGVETVDLGALQKIRIGHDNSGFGPGWFLDTVVITNGKTDEKFFFPCGRWFATNEDDGKLVREIPVHQDNKRAAPLITYHITVYTGDRRGAGTDANVHLIAYGEHGDSGTIQLENSRNNFERGRTDKFEFQSIDLGSLKRIEIGHDNKGIGAGWFLNKVVILSGEGKSWTFGCNNWLAKDEGDGLIRRELAPVGEDFKVLNIANYQITVRTGDRRGAGTDANVFITLYGPNGKSNLTFLDNSQNNFERNKADVFGLECDYLGELTKIVIGHDNKGFGAAWFLDKVEVFSERDNKTYFFLSGKWFSTSDDDKQIVREIPASNENGVCTLPLITYKVEVLTGDRRGAGTDANVSITIYGDKGDTGKRVLDGPGNNFERNQTDEFGIEAVELGSLQKIRIGHDDSGIGAAWFLDKVIITNTVTKAQTFFLCGKWLDKSSGDKQIVREIPATNQNGETYAPLTRYKISVYTANRRGAGTDANVFIHLFGDKGESDDLKLDNSLNNFERGQLDIFGFQMVDLGNLKKIRIGHDNKGIGAGWMLDKVVVYCENGAKEWFFPSGRWFDLHEDDGLLIREIDAAEKDINGCPPLTTYNLSIFTGDRRFAGTNAQIHLQLYGEKGNTDVFKIDAKHGSFERGTQFDYSLECGHLGNVTKIRIGHDNKGVGAGWFLDKVIAKDEKEQKTYYFLCGRWLADNEEDEKIEREIASTNQDGKTYAPETRYQITVYTGDRRGAGTDANVYIKLVGEHGDTGLISLDNNQNNFERNKKDVFEYFGVSLGKLKRILIGHDGKGIGSAWFLDKVVVKAEDLALDFFFLSGQWIDSDHGLEKVIEVADKDGQASLPLVYYEVQVFTGDRRGAGTDANVFLTLYGANGDSGERKLDNSQNNFERGKKDMFGFEIVDLGELKKARIRHDNKGLAAGWYLDKIIIKDVKRNVFNYFVCNKWLDTKEDDGLIERELGCSLEDKEIPIPTKQYKIKTITGDVPGAGTDANVFIVITGANGATRETTLDSKGNNFERAQTDEFELSLYDLGELKKIRIGHHSKGPGAGWFLEKVIITPMTGDTEDAPWYFVCQRWLDTNEDDFQTVRELGASLEDKMTSLPWVDYKVSVFTGDRRGAGTSANVSVTIYGESGDSGDRRLDARSGSFERGSVSHFNFEMLDLGKITKLRIGHDNKGIASGWFLDKVVLQAGTGQTYFFLFGRWLDLNEEDGKIVVEGVPAPEDAVTYLPEVTYKVRVKTGDRRGAGTDANVFIELYGDQGKSGEKVLDNKLNNFERNKEDLFGLVCVDVGIPTKIRIRHDNSGIGPGWFLDKIIIHNEKDQKDYYFLCGKWLATDEDDRVIEREIPASNEDGVCTVPLVKYKVIVKTGDRWGAGTDANVSITIYGEKGDTGKRTLDGPGNNFERKKEDVFGVEAVELGEIKKIRIEHDDSGLGAAWFLESVTIEDDKNNRVFFGCGHWLARDEEDGLISRELIATDPSGFSVAPYQNYTVSVTTGDRFGAGTNANISIIVYGANGDSGKRKLETTRGGFERGQTDVFSVECVDLGDLTRLEIGHDNKGIGAGWFLDKVTIKNGRGQQWYFLCGRWLADNEDDKLIKREIKATLQDAKTYQPLIDYKITIKTADRPGAGTDANVFLVITGDQGESAEIKLDNAQNNFERNKVDVFSTQCVCLGNLTKIRLRHDNKGIGAAWLPEKVEILDESIQKVVFFPIVGELWIDKNNLTREFSASDKEGKPLLPLKTYQVVVVTGDRRGAGTDANVFIDVHGEHGNSGRRNLDNSENNFERGKTDTFGFDSVDLGKIIKIQVGHDNKGVGAAWFLDKVILTDMSNNTNNYFLCGKWLEKDNLLVELAAQTEDGKSCLPEVNYQVKVSTADIRGAGTNAKVSLTIYGESGDTGARILDGQFERNIIDEFTIAAIDLGDLKKIRVGHDNSGFGPGWYLDRISIRSSTTGKEWYFTAGRWLDSKEGDKKIEIELEAKNKDGAPLVPLVTYKITTITGDRRGAGTDANVYIELYGDLGKTGVQKLDGGKDSYERGVTSQFGVDSIDIGTIKKIRIGHDNKGFGPGWLLDKVLVTNLKTGQNYFFLCGKWLATDEGDGLIEREMIASMEDATVLPPLTNYKVLVTTGDKKGAGTNANVSIVIYGDKGDTGIRKLEGKDTFEQGKTDVFGVEAADLGNLTKLRIGHDDKGFRAGWFLDKVQIQNETTGKSWYFLAGRWLDKSEGDKRIQVELPAKDQDGVSYLPETMYTVIISTGDCNSAGTRANVFMTLFGDKGDTGQFKLNNSHLERGTVEEFEHMAVDLGKLSKINIGHDNRGLSSDWFLDKVVIRNETTGIETTFSCQQWLATDKGEKKLVRDIFPAKDGEKVSNVSKYLVEVITGDVFGASTNANVFITIFGTRNNTEKTTLDNEENNFERAKTDRFTVEFPDLGEVTKIRIGHDNKRVGLTDPNWYCKSVSVTSLRTSDTWFFNIDKWFDTGVGDKLIVRECEPTQNNKI